MPYVCYTNLRCTELYYTHIHYVIHIGILALIYCLVAGFGYYIYDDNIYPNVIMNIQVNHTLYIAINILVILTTGSKFSLASYPITECIYDICELDVSKVYMSKISSVMSSILKGIYSVVSCILGPCYRCVYNTIHAIPSLLQSHPTTTASPPSAYGTFTTAKKADYLPLFNTSNGRPKPNLTSRIPSLHDILDYNDLEVKEEYKDIHGHTYTHTHTLRRPPPIDIPPTPTPVPAGDASEAGDGRSPKSVQPTHLPNLTRGMHIHHSTTKSNSTTNRVHNNNTTYQKYLKIMIRSIIPIYALFLLYISPNFGKLLTIIGGVFGSIICVILPLLFYIHIYKDELSISYVLLLWLLLCVCTVVGIAICVLSAIYT